MDWDYLLWSFDGRISRRTFWIGLATVGLIELAFHVAAQSLDQDRLSSIILFGPPGTGKTSLARVVAATTRSGFAKLNAVTAGVADIKRVIADTENPILNPLGRTLLFPWR